MAAVALDLDVLIEEQAWQEIVPDADVRCRAAARAAWLLGSPCPATPTTATATACLLLASDDRVRALNQQFRGYDVATDVLSFPAVELDVRAAAGADGLPSELGDIIIALQTTRADAEREGKPVSHHLSHLVVHGMLHLLGYDHQRDEEAAEMEELEVRILASLGIADPYNPLDQT